MFVLLFVLVDGSPLLTVKLSSEAAALEWYLQTYQSQTGMGLVLALGASSFDFSSSAFFSSDSPPLALDSPMASPLLSQSSTPPVSKALLHQHKKLKLQSHL
ncbi:hypothetical protein V6N13_114559 [Hibiscus sabdariffa]|uniref:Uncharacterized protein n=1 Tax=Hibiscus sabdariffa TaxID=183260 RepID=A0ABR2U2F5_9ROSI